MNKLDIIHHMRQSYKPKNLWKIGLEYEVFIWKIETLKPLAYDDSPGIKQVFLEFIKLGWKPVVLDNITHKLSKDSASISYEPGGQIEFASHAHTCIHHLYLELKKYEKMLSEVCDRLGLEFIGVGFHPSWKIDDIPIMPSPDNRSNLIVKHMREIGSNGIDLIFRCCSTQVSIDYSNEIDMTRKYQLALKLQPFISLAFANSSIKENKMTDFKSIRTHAWYLANPNRCDMIDVIFHENFNLETYIDFIINQPLYFTTENSQYLDAHKEPFANFLSGNSSYPRKLAKLSDWHSHLSTFWPEARLRNLIEMRGADSGSIEEAAAVAAIWVGLLYNEKSISEAQALADWHIDIIKILRKTLNETGFKTQIKHNKTALDILQELVCIAEDGLKHRHHQEGLLDESGYLYPIKQMITFEKNKANQIQEMVL